MDITRDNRKKTTDRTVTAAVCCVIAYTAVSVMEAIFDTRKETAKEMRLLKKVTRTALPYFPVSLSFAAFLSCELVWYRADIALSPMLYGIVGVHSGIFDPVGSL